MSNEEGGYEAEIEALTAGVTHLAAHAAMLEEQLTIAIDNINYHQERLGFQETTIKLLAKQLELKEGELYDVH